MSTFISKEDNRAKKRVEALVEDWYDVTVEQLQGVSKDQNVVRARYICFFLLKRDFGMHINLIAALYNKDHSTIINGLNRVTQLQLWKDVRTVELSTYPHL